MAKRLFFLLCCLAAFPAAAQYNPAWFSAKTDLTATTNNNGARQILAVRNSTVLWGRMVSTSATVGSEVYGNYNVTLYDTLGNALLGVTVTGTAQLLQAQTDGEGNWYILGRFLNSITLPGPITRTRGANEPDHFIMRLGSNNLGVNWFKSIGFNEKCKANTFTINADNLYLPMDSATLTVVHHYNTNTGNVTRLWTQKGTSNSSAIAADSLGDIYLAGSCANPADGLVFNTVASLPPAGNSFPAYIVRYRAGGIYDWHYWLWDNACPVQRELTIRNTNTVYFSGGLHDSLTLGNLSAHPPVNTTDYLAARLDSNGTVSWLRQTDPNSGGGEARMDYNTNATLLPDGTLALFPQVDGTLYWNDSILTIANAGATATVIGMNANTGRVMWNLYPTAAQQTTPQHITAEGNGVYITGNALTLTGEVHFGPYTLTMPPGSYYPFYARIRLRDTIPVVPPQSAQGQTLSDVLRSAPNPATGKLYLTGMDALGTERSTDLLDPAGRIVLHREITGDRLILSVGDLPRGLYTLRLHGTAGTVHRKLVLQ